MAIFPLFWQQFLLKSAGTDGATGFGCLCLPATEQSQDHCPKLPRAGATRRSCIPRDGTGGCKCSFPPRTHPLLLEIRLWIYGECACKLICADRERGHPSLPTSIRARRLLENGNYGSGFHISSPSTWWSVVIKKQKKKEKNKLCFHSSKPYVLVIQDGELTGSLLTYVSQKKQWFLIIAIRGSRTAHCYRVTLKYCALLPLWPSLECNASVLSERNLSRDLGDFILAGKGTTTNSKFMLKIHAQN